MSSAIDRIALVRRHNPVLTALDPTSPLSVGNGEFAFTADVTGLQTFDGEYASDPKHTPLCTMSQWGWHSFPKPPDLPPLELTEYDAHGRKVGYATGRNPKETVEYLRTNPHRLHLGRVGFSIHTRDGRIAKPEDLREVRQELDLFAGTLLSKWRVDDNVADVRTCAHPMRDALAVDVRGSLLERNFVSVLIKFPGASPSVAAADWDHPKNHSTWSIRTDRAIVQLGRKLDDDRYTVTLQWYDGTLQRRSEHECELTPRAGSQRFWFTCEFTPTENVGDALDADATFTAAAEHGKKFWVTGGAVDLSGSRDERWKELERRIVLSQYLTAIQCSGSLPPAETGLTCNSWYGKFHLEMHWWHAAHFPLWGRPEMLERSLGYYDRILDSARERAKQQGYEGARWPKMADPSGRDSPSPIGPLLIWQQSHPIYFAELCYRAHPDDATAKRFADIVQATAEFMASYAWFNEKTGRYDLGPPVIPAQENHPARETWNPTYELAYWRFGLRVANEWRRRLKIALDPSWNKIIAHLAPMPAADGVYLAHENCPQTFTERNRDHPSMLAALGVLPADDHVDTETMRRTLKKVLSEWRWDDTWGWDYPMAAMTAARLGERALAIDLLLKETPKNVYKLNGHNYQRPGLSLYLPGNGGLLTAIAMMAGGWSTAGQTAQSSAPGFPNDGSWTVRAEGLLPIL